MGLSKFQYITIRNESTKCGNNQWPSYYNLCREKNKCYLPKSISQITESFATVELQSLLDHTASRIFKNLQNFPQNSELKLICKWGYDGTAGQEQYKYRTYDSVFVSSMAPLKLKNKLTSECL